MTSTSTRKRGLSPKALETIYKFLPENNSEKPEGFPISYTEFCEFTNIHDVTIKAIKQLRPKSYKEYLRNDDCVRAQKYSLYLSFYKSSERRNQIPLNELYIKDSCPEELRKVVLRFRKSLKDTKQFPVSFEIFCKYTNCANLVDEHFKKHGKSCDKSTAEWEKCARQVYQTFYSTEKRAKLQIEIKPCTKTFKEQILKFPEDISLESEEDSHVSKSPKHRNNLHPANETVSKRPRIDNEVDRSEFNEENFPITYDTFLMHTNIKDIAEKYLQNGSVIIPDPLDVANLTRKLYIDYYTKPRNEHNLIKDILVRGLYADQITSLSSYQCSTNINNKNSDTNEANAIVIQSVVILPSLRSEKNNDLILDAGVQSHLPGGQKETSQAAQMSSDSNHPITVETVLKESNELSRCNIQHKTTQAMEIFTQTNEAPTLDLTEPIQSKLHYIHQDKVQAAQVSNETNQVQIMKITDRVAFQSTRLGIQRESVHATQMYIENNEPQTVELTKGSDKSKLYGIQQGIFQGAQVSDQMNQHYTERKSIQPNRQGMQHEFLQALQMPIQTSQAETVKRTDTELVQSHQSDLRKEIPQAVEVCAKRNQPQSLEMTHSGSIQSNWRGLQPKTVKVTQVSDQTNQHHADRRSLRSNRHGMQTEFSQAVQMSFETSQDQAVKTTYKGPIQSTVKAAQMSVQTNQAETVKVTDEESTQSIRSGMQKDTLMNEQMSNQTNQHHTDKASIQLSHHGIQQKTTTATHISTKMDPLQTVKLTESGLIQSMHLDIPPTTVQTPEMAIQINQSETLKITDKGSIPSNQSSMQEETHLAEQMSNQTYQNQTDKVLIEFGLYALHQKTTKATQMFIETNESQTVELTESAPIQSIQHVIQDEPIHSAQMSIQTNQAETPKITDKRSIKSIRSGMQKETPQTAQMSTQTNQHQTMQITDGGSIKSKRRDLQKEISQVTDTFSKPNEGQTVEITQHGTIQSDRRGTQQKTVQVAYMPTERNQSESLEITDIRSNQLNPRGIQQENSQASQMSIKTNKAQNVKISDIASIQSNPHGVQKEHTPSAENSIQMNQLQAMEGTDIELIQSNGFSIQKEEDDQGSTNKEDMWQYPVSFDLFCKYANLNEVIENEYKERTNIECERCYAMVLDVAYDVYQNFYKSPEKRKKYALSFKPVPKHLKKNLLNFASRKDEASSIHEEKGVGETVADSVQLHEQLTEKVENNAFDKDIQKSILLISDNSKDKILDEKDDIDYALKQIFGESDSESNKTVIHISDRNKTLKVQRKMLQEEAVELSSKSSDLEPISGGESIQLYQHVPTESTLHRSSPYKNSMLRFSQIQSHSMLQPLNLTNSVSSQESIASTEHFIDMPNTQQQYEALKINGNNTPFKSDPLNGSLVGVNLNEAQYDGKQISSTGIPIEEDRLNTTEKPELLVKIKEENITQGIVPLRNLQFNLDESDTTFDVRVISEEAILLNDSLDSQHCGCISNNFRTQLRSLVHHLDNSRQYANDSIPLQSSESFVCTEAQHFPSSMYESSERNDIVQNIPAEAGECKSSKEEPVCNVDSTNNPEHHIELQSISEMHRSSKKTQENDAEYPSNAKKDIISQEIGSLRNLQINLDESGNNLELCVFSDEPILLNERFVNPNDDCNSNSCNQQLKSLVTNQFGNPNKEVSDSIPFQASKASFDCVETKRTPSSEHESSQQKQSTDNFPVEAGALKSPNKEPVCDINITKSPKSLIKSKKMPKTYHKRKKTQGKNIKLMSKDLSYDIPQILHEFRSLKNQGISGRKK